MSDRWINSGRTVGRPLSKIKLFLHTLIMRGSDVASLAEICQVISEEIARRTNGRTTNAWTDVLTNGHLGG